MADFFFDTSALVKRFSRETGTAWVIDLVRPASGHIIYLANITSVEVVSAVTRRMRGGHLTVAAAKKALTRFHRSFLRRYVIVEINPPLISRANDSGRDQCSAWLRRGAAGSGFNNPP